MKIPRTAPDRAAVMLGGSPGIAEAWDAVKSPLVDGKYIHWDKLLRFTPPEGLDHESWWLGLLFQRGAKKDVPLRDTKGEVFRYLLVDPMPQRLHEIDTGAGGLVSMPDQITNPDVRGQYYVGSLIEEAITSSQLEGAATTRRVAKEMIRAGRKPKDRSERMILNNYMTMKHISSLKKQRFSTSAILELHRLVTDATLDEQSAVGRFRTSDDIVVMQQDGTILHRPPPARELAARMESMCAFANGESDGGEFIHPVIRAIALHFWLAYEHPFVDGNGRTARALFYWSMLRSGFWMFEFISISNILLKAPTQYYMAFLHTETDNNDLTYFILHQLDVISKAVESLHSYITRKTRELQEVEAGLQTVTLLNHRQRSLIAHALRHPNQIYTVKSHMISHNVVYETARTDLRELAKQGYLTSSKSGRTWVYRPVADLAGKLGAE